MELESMFTEQKWNIIRSLAEGKYSPYQLAEKLNTTMANISQQLRLLEASNLVKKEKIKNRDRGKPRTLFSLTDDYAYLISAMHSFASKKLIKVNQHHKIILKIWFIEDEKLQQGVERLYWALKPRLDNVNFIAVDLPAKEVFICCDKKEVESLARKEPVQARIFSKNYAADFVKQNIDRITSNDLLVIYDPEDLVENQST